MSYPGRGFVDVSTKAIPHNFPLSTSAERGGELHLLHRNVEMFGAFEAPQLYFELSVK